VAKAELKTKEIEASIEEFLNSVDDEERRKDSFKVLDMFKRITGEEPKMWGPSIVGFGSRVLKYDSGRELDWMLTGFSPRKGNLTLYIIDGFAKHDDLMARLGKHKTGKSCLYVKKLSDIDQSVLEELILESIDYIKRG
jgi:hypothetical protein